MGKNVEIAFGFIVIILVVVGFIVAGISTFPSENEINAAKGSEQITMPVDVSKLEAFDEIKNYERNGDIPVKPLQSELGRVNPFAPI